MVKEVELNAGVAVEVGNGRSGCGRRVALGEQDAAGQGEVAFGESATRGELEVGTVFVGCESVVGGAGFGAGRDPLHHASGHVAGVGEFLAGADHGGAGDAVGGVVGEGLVADAGGVAVRIVGDMRIVDRVGAGDLGEAAGVVVAVLAGLRRAGADLDTAGGAGAVGARAWVCATSPGRGERVTEGDLWSGAGGGEDGLGEASDRVVGVGPAGGGGRGGRVGPLAGGDPPRLGAGQLLGERPGPDRPPGADQRPCGCFGQVVEGAEGVGDVGEFAVGVVADGGHHVVPPESWRVPYAASRLRAAASIS